MITFRVNSFIQALVANVAVVFYGGVPCEAGIILSSDAMTGNLRITIDDPIIYTFPVDITLTQYLTVIVDDIFDLPYAGTSGALSGATSIGFNEIAGEIPGPAGTIWGPIGFSVGTIDQRDLVLSFEVGPQNFLAGETLTLGTGSSLSTIAFASLPAISTSPTLNTYLVNGNTVAVVTNTTTVANGPLPEPMTWMVLGIGAVGIIRRNCRRIV